MKENIEAQSEIFIVPANPQDIREMQEVFFKTWLVTYPNKEAGITIEDIEDQFKDAFKEETLTKIAERIKNPPKGHVLFFAKQSEKIVGICRIVNRLDFDQLQAIYVLPEYQKRGVGKLLWEEAQKYFSSEKDVVVQVATYNTQAIEFYKKLGFVDTGKRFSEDRFTMKSGAKMPEMEMIIRRDSKISKSK